MNNFRNIRQNIINNNFLKNILYIIVALPSLFLLNNKYPYLMIASVLVVVGISFISFLYIKGINPYSKPILIILTIIFVYFLLSYFYSGQSIKNIFTFNYLRYDGNFFFCYILFLLCLCRFLIIGKYLGIIFILSLPCFRFLR